MLPFRTEQIEHPALPPFIEMQDGYEFCTLCGKYGNPDHYRSKKHNNKVWWWQHQGLTQQARLAPSVPAVGLQQGAAAYGVIVALPSPPPGDPSWYEWQTDKQTWYCKLCWKTADDNHIGSERHKRNVQWEQTQALTEQQLSPANPWDQQPSFGSSIGGTHEAQLLPQQLQQLPQQALLQPQQQQRQLLQLPPQHPQRQSRDNFESAPEQGRH